MKFKSIVFVRLVLCSLLTLCTVVLRAKPLDYEDVASLLPAEPRDTNETMAAIVQDPVVKDAVQHAASNGSLNGLVVRRKVFVMPANNPSKVISQREQIFVVPTEHLEDVRRNITESKETEADSDEDMSTDSQSFENKSDEYATIKSESDLWDTGVDSKSSEALYESSKNSVLTNDDLNQENHFMEGMLTQRPEAWSKKVSVPIVAVVDPSNIYQDSVEAPIVAVLPRNKKESTLGYQVNFLQENQEKIQEQTQAYVDRSLLAVSPEQLTVSSSAPEASNIQSNEETESSESQDQFFLTPLVLPDIEIVGPLISVTEEGANYPEETEDMDLAEDIIFRPLFRYRQEAEKRSKFRDDGNNFRRSGYRRYNSYQNYNSYPRRDYYRPRYYNDYY